MFFVWSCFTIGKKYRTNPHQLTILHEFVQVSAPRPSLYYYNYNYLYQKKSIIIYKYVVVMWYSGLHSNMNRSNCVKIQKVCVSYKLCRPTPVPKQLLYIYVVNMLHLVAKFDWWSHPGWIELYSQGWVDVTRSILLQHGFNLSLIATF